VLLEVMHLTLPRDAIAKVLATLSHSNHRKGTTDLPSSALSWWHEWNCFPTEKAHERGSSCHDGVAIRL
jgi:hypothetical protein